MSTPQDETQSIVNQIGEFEIAFSGMGIVTRNGEIVYDTPPEPDPVQLVEIRVIKNGELIAVLERKGGNFFEGVAIAPAALPLLCFGITAQGTMPIDPKWDFEGQISKGDALGLIINEKNISGH